MKKMKTLTTKAISVLIVIMMLLWQLPLSVIATDTGDNTGTPIAWIDADSDGVRDEGETTYTSLADAFDAAEDGDTIVLLADVTEFSYTIGSGNSVTLDLNGYTITLNGWFDVFENSTLTVKDSSAAKTGTIVCDENAMYMDIYTGGTLIIEGGMVEIVRSTESDASVTVDGGTVSKLIVNSGTITVGTNASVTAWELSNLTVGTTFNFDPTTLSSFDSDAFDVTNENGVYTVTQKDSSGDSGDTGDTGDNTPTAPIAWIDTDSDGVQDEGETTYTSLADAFDAAEDGDTIVLLADVTEFSYTIGSGNSVTLDLNGYTITLNGWFDVFGNSTLTVKDSSAAKTGTIVCDEDSKYMDIYNGGTLIIEGGTVGIARSDESEASVTVGGGTVSKLIVNSGTVTVGTNATVTAWDFTDLASGTTFNFDPTTLSSFDSDAFDVTNENGVYTVTQKDSSGDSGDTGDTGDNTPTAPIAWIDTDSDGVQDEGETTYTSLADAFDAAEDGDTIVLLADVTEFSYTIGSGNSVTLDLNGYTITLNGWFDVFGNSTLTVKDSSAAKTGTIVCDEDSKYMDIYNGGTLIIEGGTVGIARSDESEASVTVGGGTVSKLIVNSGTVTVGTNATVTAWDFTDLASGTTFNFDPTTLSSFDSDAFDVTNENGVYTVTQKDSSGDSGDTGDTGDNTPTAPIAWIDTDSDGVQDEGETTYTSLADAFDAAEDGDTIVLLADVTEFSYTIGSGNSVTLDLNGYTITLNGWFDVFENSTLTVKDSSAAKTGTIVCDENAMYMDIYTGGTLIIEGGMVEIVRSTESDASVTVDGGTVLKLIVNSGTITVGTNASVTAWEITVGTFNFDPIATITDFVLDTSKYELVDNKDGTYSILYVPVFSEVYVDYTYDLSVLYGVQISNVTLEDNKLALLITHNGKTVTLTEDIRGDNLVTFVYNGITPERMGDTLDATLVFLDEDGKVLKTLDTHTGFTAEGSLKEKLETASDDMKQIIVDLLAYGAAAQQYKDYNADDLVNADLDASLVAGTATPDSTDKSATTSTSAVGTKLIGAGVWVNGYHSLYFRIVSNDIENVSIGISVGGSDEKVYGYTAADNGYLVFTDDIDACDFGETYTVKLYDGETCVQTITYSINAYIYEMLNSSQDAELKAMLTALYNYGLAANNYYQGAE